MPRPGLTRRQLLAGALGGIFLTACTPAPSGQPRAAVTPGVSDVTVALPASVLRTLLSS